MNSLAALQLPAAVEAWTGHDTRLLVVAAVGIALIVALGIVAVLSVATTVQRIWHVHRLSSAGPAVATNQSTREK